MYANSEWIAASRLLRLRTLLPRVVSRCSRNAAISGASSWAMSSSLGVLPVRFDANASSSRNVWQ
jgi:hypothetical protein